MEQVAQQPAQPITKRTSKRWKWMILIFVVADFWGIWLFQSMNNPFASKVPDDINFPDYVPYFIAQKCRDLYNKNLSCVLYFKCSKGDKVVYRVDVSDNNWYFYDEFGNAIGTYYFTDAPNSHTQPPPVDLWTCEPIR